MFLKFILIAFYAPRFFAVFLYFGGKYQVHSYKQLLLTSLLQQVDTSENPYIVMLMTWSNICS